MLVADGWSSTGSLRTEGGEEQQPDAYDYRGVGSVEDVPEAEVDVVRDLSAAQTVEEVACGAAQDQTAPEHCERRWSPRQQHPEHDHDGNGASEEENHLASAEHAEGPTVVPYVGEAKEAWHENDALPNPHRALDDGLYALVDDEDREREREGEEQTSPAGHDEAGCISGALIGTLILAYRRRRNLRRRAESWPSPGRVALAWRKQSAGENSRTSLSRTRPLRWPRWCLDQDGNCRRDAPREAPGDPANGLRTQRRARAR